MTDHYKTIEDAINQLIACHDEQSCPAITVANEALTALRELQSISAQKPVGCGYVVKYAKGITPSTYEEGYAIVKGVDVYTAPSIELVQQLVDAIAINRVMAKDVDGNYTREVTPKIISAALDVGNKWLKENQPKS